MSTITHAPNGGGGAAADELRREQEHMDRAWAARERTRANLGQAAGASAGKAAVAVGRAARRVAQQLGGPDEPVAIGRIDRADARPLHIGKHAISDDDSNLLVIGWKADAAAPYFTATVDDACGLARKRTYQMQRNTVLDFDDVVFAELAARVDELTQHEEWGVDDAVLRDLDAGRTGEMRDIVATIHAAQYELVRSPLDRLLLVQGGPGTGKTVVALHRVSWLLYQHRATLRPEDVLVVGPNRTFTRYILAVLPGLGDADVVHRDLQSLGPVASTGRTESDAVARLKGDGRMAGLITRAMIHRVRFPERTERLEVLVGDSSPVVLPRAEVEHELRSRIASARSYTAGRGAMRAWLTSAVGQRVRWGTRVPPAAVDAALERVWPSLSAAAFLRDLLSSRERLLAAAGDDFSASEVQLLVRSASERMSDETWTDADVALLDEAEHLLTAEGSTFAHVVLDEAQDLSPMQLRSVHRRCPEGSMTVVGDLAQSTGAWARDHWDDVVAALRGKHPAQVEELSLGYRVPQQVFELAARLLPHIAPAISAPTVVRRGPADPDLRRVDAGDVALDAVQAAREYAGRGLFVGIVCPDSHRADVTETLRRAEVNFTDTRGGSLGSSINLVTPTAAKGLEFDAVVVVEPEDVVAAGERGLRLLYVALTRTTKHLTIVYSRNALPIPGDDDGTASSAGTAKAGDTVDRGARPLAAVTSLSAAPAATATPAGTAEIPAPNPLIRAVAEELARQVRATVQPASYAAVVNDLRAVLDEEAP